MNPSLPVTVVFSVLWAGTRPEYMNIMFVVFENPNTKKISIRTADSGDTRHHRRHSVGRDITDRYLGQAPANIHHPVG